MKIDSRNTLPRSAKGPVAAPPVLRPPLQSVVDAVASWPGIQTTVHWDLYDQSLIDGVDFYLGAEELGHLHLDGSIHLATSRTLGKRLIADGLAKPFRYQSGWVEEKVQRIGSDAAVALFHYNYNNLQEQACESNPETAVVSIRTSTSRAPTSGIG